MIKHIVLWKLKNPEAAGEIMEGLQSLPAHIPQIREFEVGLCIGTGEAAADVALLSSFENCADLQSYLEHPEHCKVATRIRELTCDRRVADYEIG